MFFGVREMSRNKLSGIKSSNWQKKSINSIVDRGSIAIKSREWCRRDFGFWQAFRSSFLPKLLYDSLLLCWPIFRIFSVSIKKNLKSDLQNFNTVEIHKFEKILLGTIRLWEFVNAIKVLCMQSDLEVALNLIKAASIRTFCGALSNK
jgi:hypothetical protein